jgi:hypothetical protein
MTRIVLALAVVGLLCGVAQAAGVVKWDLVASGGTADGTLKIIGGNPKDPAVKIHLSVTGLDPSTEYTLKIGAGGENYVYAITTDTDGACTFKASTTDPILAATDVGIIGGLGEVMYGIAR